MKRKPGLIFLFTLISLLPHFTGAQVFEVVHCEYCSTNRIYYEALNYLTQKELEFKDSKSIYYRGKLDTLTNYNDDPLKLFDVEEYQDTIGFSLAYDHFNNAAKSPDFKRYKFSRRSKKGKAELHIYPMLDINCESCFLKIQLSDKGNITTWYFLRLDGKSYRQKITIGP